MTLCNQARLCVQRTSAADSLCKACTNHWSSFSSFCQECAWRCDAEQGYTTCAWLRSCGVMKRQDLSCTYLAHHELESVIIIIVIIISIIMITIIMWCALKDVEAAAGEASEQELSDTEEEFRTQVRTWAVSKAQRHICLCICLCLPCTDGMPCLQFPQAPCMCVQWHAL